MKTNRSQEKQFGVQKLPRLRLPALLFACSAFCSPSLLPASLPGIRERVISDPCLGIHWQLRSDPLHPGGPAHLVQVGQNEAPEIRTSSASAQPLVIRTGETVVIDQDSPVLHARLLGIALASAALGQSVPVRLNRVKGFESSTGTATVTVVATGARSAQWVGSERSSR